MLPRPSGCRFPVPCAMRLATLLVAEARHRRGDGRKTDIVLRRGTDRGATWTKSQILARAAGEDNHVLPKIVEERASRIFFVRAVRNEGINDLTTRNFRRMSDDDGATWSARRLIRPGSFSYSNLDRLPDGTLLLLFGDAAQTQITLARFSLDWVRTGAP